MSSVGYHVAVRVRCRETRARTDAVVGMAWLECLLYACIPELHPYCADFRSHHGQLVSSRRLISFAPQSDNVEPPRTWPESEIGVGGLWIRPGFDETLDRDSLTGSVG